MVAARSALSVAVLGMLTAIQLCVSMIVCVLAPSFADKRSYEMLAPRFTERTITFIQGREFELEFVAG